jgi:hypothetical protein
MIPDTSQVPLRKRCSKTYFLHRSHALLTLVLPFSVLFLFADGSLSPASGSRLSVSGLAPFADVHFVEALSSTSDMS